MIEKCAFGSMTIDGRTYTTDLKILPDGRVRDGWWRARGHRLTWDDIADLSGLHAQVLVVGTGIYGRMKPEKDLEARLAEQGIDLVTAWSRKAADIYNHNRQQGVPTMACFHLTC